MKNFYLILICLGTSLSFGQIESFDWPTGPGEAILSDRYEVYVRNGNDTEIQLEVLMSNADYEGDFRADELQGRTFSFVNLNYDVGAGAGLTFRVVKLFGDDSESVEIAPRSYGIQHSMVNGKEITFSIDDNNKYISVNFQGSDNVTSPNNWIVHMLGIFIDPPESAASFSCAASAITYSPDLPAEVLINANAIEFEPGYHNLRDYQNKGAGFISEQGVLTLRDDQELYIAGGAFVEGLIVRDKFQDRNQRIYGRGILSGRQFVWQGNPNSDGTEWGQIIIFGFDPVVEGITILDSPNHGIVAPENAKISNIKLIGWHANNDGIRVGSKSEIQNSFLRCVDDHFYNWNIYVHDCVLWGGHNGAILTYGWSDIPTGSSVLENIDVINSEWLGRGNNNGLVASQVALDFFVQDYGEDSQSGSTTTILRDIRVEGDIAALANIKPRSGSGGAIIAEPVAQADLGFIGDLLMENITVDGQKDKSRIEGLLNATTDGSGTFFARDMTFTNISIGGTRLTEDNQSLFFDVDPETTENIVFDSGGGANAETQIEDFVAPILVTVDNETSSDLMAALPAGTGSWFTVNTDGNVDWQVKPTDGNPDEHLTRNTDNRFAKGAAYVFNNSNKTSGGTMDMSFDYFYSTSADADRMSYRVYGVKDPEGDGPNGVIKMTGGSGAFGDNFASEYDGSDGEEFYVDNALTQTDDWTTLNYGTVDLTEYEYLIITFAIAFNNSDASNPSAIMGIDNVVVPKTRPFIPSADTQIEDFVTPTIVSVENETTATDILAIPENTGTWFTVNSFGNVDWQVKPTDGNPDEHLTRNNDNRFAKGAAYVFNNSNGVSGGGMDMSFDYFYSTAADADRMSYRVYGVKDPEGDGPNGAIVMTGGSGAFGDNFASEYNGSDADEFYVDNALTQTDEWTTVNYGIVDLTGYEYLIITFSIAFNNSDASDPTAIMGIDNVVVPLNDNSTSGKKNLEGKTKAVGFYANPAGEQFGISVLDGSKSYTYEILDSTGRIVVPQSIGNTNMINVGELDPGLYFVRVSTPSGTTVGKMIKQ